MEMFYDIIRLGNIKIELSVKENNGFMVIMTASDEEDRRIFKAPVLEDGKVKIFKNLQDAISDARNRLLSASHP